MKRKPSDFDIRLDKTGEDTLSELNKERVDRLSLRVTLIAILVPAIIAAILALSYFDLKKRIAVIDTTGEKEVRNLSMDLESSFSALSLQVAKLEESTAAKTDKLERMEATLRGQMKRVEDSVKVLRGGKAGKRQLKTAVEKIEESLDPIREDLSRISSEIERIDGYAKSESERLARIIMETREEIVGLGVTLQTLKTMKEDIQMIEDMARSHKKEYDQKLNRTSKELDARIAEMDRLVRQLQASPGGATPGKTVKKPPQSLPSPAPPSSPEPDGIKEQDIK